MDEKIKAAIRDPENVAVGIDINDEKVTERLALCMTQLDRVLHTYCDNQSEAYTALLLHKKYYEETYGIRAVFTVKKDGEIESL